MRRARDNRAGEVRPTAGSAARVFRAVRFGTRFFGAAFRAFAAFFGFEARRPLLGRLAERAARWAFFAIFRAALRPPVFRLAMA